MMKRNLVCSDKREIGFYAGCPKFNENNDEFECEYGTFGFANDINLSAIGIDAFQSFFNALMRLEYFVRNTDEFVTLNLQWIGASISGDLGLKIPKV